MIIELEPIVLDDFSGGLDTKSSPLRIPANKVPYCINVHTNTRGAVQGRLGFTALNSISETGNQNGIYDYAQNQTTRLLVQMRGTAFSKMDALDGVWDSVTLAATLGNSSIEFDTFDLGTGSNRLVFCDNSGTAYAQYWDGSGSSVLINGANAPQGPRYMKIWQQRLFCIGKNAKPNNLVWSNSGTVTTWTAADNLDIITNDGDFPTGLAILKKNLYVLKRYSIHRVTFTGADPIIETTPIILGTGCASSKTIKNVNIPDIGEAIAFQTQDGRIVAFTGHSEGLYNLSDNISITNSISPASMDLINAAYLSTTHAVVFPSNYWYVFFCPIGTSQTTPNYALMFDYLNKGWWSWTNMNFGSAALVDSSGSLRLYAQGANYTMRLNSGNSDNGTAVLRSVYSRRIPKQSTSLITSSRGAQFTFKQNGSTNINVYNRIDWSSGWSDAESLSMAGGTSLLGGNLPLTLGADEAAVHHVDIPKMKSLIQFRMETNDTNAPWTLFRLEELSNTKGYQP